jgi:putative acetyltransferase
MPPQYTLGLGLGSSSALRCYRVLKIDLHMNDFNLRPMTLDDYAVVYALWQSTPGIGLSVSDEHDAIAAFLERNPGLSAVATSAHGIVGVVLCGHDGRRGYLHHLAVMSQYRKRGIAKMLVEHSLSRLREAHILKCNIFLFRNNESGSAFWHHNGWVTRDDLSVLQSVLLPLG